MVGVPRLDFLSKSLTMAVGTRPPGWVGGTRTDWLQCVVRCSPS